MIQVNELRIGNIVRGDAIQADKSGIRAIEFCGKILSISSVEPRIKVSRIDNVGYLYASDCMLSGVPLTEEILLKCGFEDEVLEWSIIRDVNGISFTGEFDGENFEFTAGEGIPLSRKIKHLHELQNLYRALTGEELTVNI